MVASIINQLLLPAAVFLFALGLYIALLKRRRPCAGYTVGLLPILAFAIRFLYPLFTCESDNPVGCEWAGIGIMVAGALSLVMLVFYTVLAAGLARTWRSDSGGRPSGWGFTRRTLSSIALLVVMAAAGAFCAYLANRLVQTGVFVSWRSLGTPPDMAPLPGEKAVKIASAGLRTVQIETNLGRIVKTNLEICASPQHISSNCWYNGSETGMPVPQAHPACRETFWVRKPPGQVVERVETWACPGNDREQTDYALLADGSVWVWNHRLSREPLVLMFILAPGALAGLLLGLVMVRRVFRRAAPSPITPPA